MGRTPDTRQIAVQMITYWLEKGHLPERRLAALGQNHAFVMEIVHGIIRRHAVFDWLEARWLRKPPHTPIRATLRVGLYQLLFMDMVEAYAAINESVESAKRPPGNMGAAKFVNAVLRRAQREREEVLDEIQKQPAPVRLSHPAWLLERWKQRYGTHGALDLAAWNNEPATTILRIEQARVDAAAFIDQLRTAGIEPQRHPRSSHEIFLALPRGVPVRKVPGFGEGWFTVQDPSTALAVDLLAPQPGETVLDACAAPGGKTAIIARRMKGVEKPVAMERHGERIKLLEQNRERLGLDIRIVQGDARRPCSTLGDQKFDAILLDVPCTNSGVLRRRIDARWRINAARLESLAGLQAEILTACAALLNPHGRIVYSTCSLEAEENEELTRDWIIGNPGFRLEKSQSLFPPESGTDGAYAALIRRK